MKTLKDLLEVEDVSIPPDPRFAIRRSAMKFLSERNPNLKKILERQEDPEAFLDLVVNVLNISEDEITAKDVLSTAYTMDGAS